MPRPALKKNEPKVMMASEALSKWYRLTGEYLTKDEMYARMCEAFVGGDLEYVGETAENDN